MINRFAHKYFTGRSQPVVAELTKIRHDVLQVVFETEKQYKQILESPDRLAHIALNDGCEQIFLYIRGSSELQESLLTRSVLRQMGWKTRRSQ